VKGYLVEGGGANLGNLGLAYAALGEARQAIAHAEAALQIFEQIEDPNAARVRAQLARWRGQASKRRWQFWKCWL
jgi:tetratricopeptide (TPR) repeat protein